MRSFTSFLYEANAVGSAFEKKTAQMVNLWLKKNNLTRLYDVRRFQSVFEKTSGRDEDYSDIVVENLKSGEKFFIECKEVDRSNVMNLQFDIRENGDIVPVRSVGRKNLAETELDLIGPFLSVIRKNPEYRGFIEFLNTRNPLLGNVPPSEYYFDRADDADSLTPRLLEKYNDLVKSGGVEADCKKFDPKNIRPSTRSMLVCALCWRLSDPANRTWDIFHSSDIPRFGDMIRRHYSFEKKIPVRYI